MENPATWGPLERAIDKAYSEWQNSVEWSEGPVMVLSLARYIADELRKQGLVRGDL